MKVLHYVNALDIGGIQRYIIQLVDAMPRSACQIDVCCRSRIFGVWAKRVEDLGGKIFYCPFYPDHLTFAFRLAKLLRRGRYEILHWHVAPYAGFPVFLGNLLNLPVVVHLHSTSFPSESRIFKFRAIDRLRDLYVKTSLQYAVGNASAVVAVSEAALDSSVPNRLHNDPRLVVIRHGFKAQAVPTQEVRRAFRKSLGFSEDNFVIGHAGRFDPSKNHAGLIKVFAIIHAQAPSSRLVILGDGPLLPEIEQMVANFNLEDKIKLLGSRDDAPTLITYADVLLFPSLWEGFGIVVLEAASGGVPTVGTRIPGLTEAIVDGETGILCDVDDHSGMAAAMVKMYHNRELLRMLGAAARDRVLRDFSLAKQCQAHLNLYESLVKTI